MIGSENRRLFQILTKSHIVTTRGYLREAILLKIAWLLGIVPTPLLRPDCKKLMIKMSGCHLGVSSEKSVNTVLSTLAISSNDQFTSGWNFFRFCFFKVSELRLQVY